MLRIFQNWLLILLAATMSLPAMADLETPKYKVLETAEPFEIRQYEPYMVAEVITEGERDDAVNAGFRLLADFIFGNNTVTQKIDMTAPVTQQSEKIDMTLPITQQSTKIESLLSKMKPNLKEKSKHSNSAYRKSESLSTSFKAAQYSICADRRKILLTNQLR